MKRTKKFISWLLVICMMTGCFLTSSDQAVYAQSRSSYYSRNYTLTGNGANDLIAVAKAQSGKTKANLGYTEAWCADFVSDCAALAGLGNIIPFNENCGKLKAAIIAADGQEVSSPQAGDIVFYYCNVHGYYVHVGIMTGSNSSIQGNYGGKVTDGVRQTAYQDGSHSVASGQVTISYVRPAYQGKTDTCNCSQSYAGNYTVTTSSLPLTMRSGHGTSYPQVAAIPKGTQVYVTKANGSWAHVEWNGYKGLCSMEYLTKTGSSVSPPSIRAWLSETAMGDVPSNYRTGTGYYLCYEVKDQATGKLFNQVANANYTITETFYNPDGSVAFTSSYKKSDYNWIFYKPSDPGVYTAKVQISGDYTGEVGLSFEVKEHQVIWHAWFSETKMGEKVTDCKKGTMYYLCYEILDSDTKQITSDFDGIDFSVKETIYKPDGSVGNTYSYNNSHANWIGYRFSEEGIYKGDVQVSFEGNTYNVDAKATVGHTHNYQSSITKNAACTTTGTRTYKCACGASYTETIAKTGHQHTQIRNAKSADCTSEGYTGDTYCTDCGEKISTGSTIAKKSHTAVKDKAIAATCTENGKTEGSHCAVCAAVIKEQKATSATGHTWDAGKVIVNATAAADGIRTYTCTVCGEEKTERIPAAGQKEDTDDGTQPGNTKTDIDSNSQLDNTQTNIDDSWNNDGQDELDGSSEDEADPDDEDESDFDDEEDEEIIEVGDMILDDASDAKYEVVTVNGTAVCVEYAECMDSGAKVIKIPATIKTDEGTVCKVVSISAGAFKNHKSLKKAVIGSNVKVIGAKAFYGCKKLKNLTIKTKKLTSKGVHKKAFKGIASKTVIKVPNSKLKAYKKLLRKKGLSSKNKFRKA